MAELNRTEAIVAALGEDPPSAHPVELPGRSPTGVTTPAARRH
jgi:hypothetical protein